MAILPQYKRLLVTLGSTIILIVLTTMLLIFYAKEVWKTMGISTGCLLGSFILVFFTQKYIAFDYSMPLKALGYFLHSLPLLAGVMFISIGSTLKRQDDGTYKMGDSEPPFGKTTGPEAYYITGSMLIVQFFVLMYSTYYLRQNEGGVFDESKPSLPIQGKSFTSSSHLDSDGVPNFIWNCKQDNNQWICTPEKK